MKKRLLVLVLLTMFCSTFKVDALSNNYYNIKPMLNYSCIVATDYNAINKQVSEMFKKQREQTEKAEKEAAEKEKEARLLSTVIIASIIVSLSIIIAANIINSNKKEKKQKKIFNKRI